MNITSSTTKYNQTIYTWLNKVPYNPDYTGNMVWTEDMIEWIEIQLLKYYDPEIDGSKDFTNYGRRNHNVTQYLRYDALRPYLEGYARLLQYEVKA